MSDEKKLKVIEIFKSIDGEGIRAGFPVTFIRLGGCNLYCSYCDSTYAWQGDYEYTEMSWEEIFKKVYMMGCLRVTLTGGEPLIHQHVDSLIKALTTSGFEVNIETNGSVDIEKYTHWDNVLITMDYKCPSSKMSDMMYLPNLANLRRKDVLKFVVGSKDDLDVCRDIVKYTSAQVFISPVFGKIEPEEIVKYMLEHDMQDCRIQLQLHKFIWSPDTKGV